MIGTTTLLRAASRRIIPELARFAMLVAAGAASISRYSARSFANAPSSCSAWLQRPRPGAA